MSTDQAAPGQLGDGEILEALLSEHSRIRGHQLKFQIFRVVVCMSLLLFFLDKSSLLAEIDSLHESIETHLSEINSSLALDPTATLHSTLMLLDTKDSKAERDVVHWTSELVTKWSDLVDDDKASTRLRTLSLDNFLAETDPKIASLRFDVPYVQQFTFPALLLTYVPALILLLLLYERHLMKNRLILARRIDLSVFGLVEKPIWIGSVALGFSPLAAFDNLLLLAAYAATTYVSFRMVVGAVIADSSLHLLLSLSLQWLAINLMRLEFSPAQPMTGEARRQLKRRSIDLAC